MNSINELFSQVTELIFKEVTNKLDENSQEIGGRLDDMYNHVKQLEYKIGDILKDVSELKDEFSNYQRVSIVSNLNNQLKNKDAELLFLRKQFGKDKKTTKHVVEEKPQEEIHVAEAATENNDTTEDDNTDETTAATEENTTEGVSVEITPCESEEVDGEAEEEVEAEAEEEVEAEAEEEAEEAEEEVEAAEAEAARTTMVERVAENDDQLMMSYLEGHEIDQVELKKGIRRATISNAVTPVLTGSALKDKGVQPLLDAVIDYLPSPLDVPPIVAHDPKDPEVAVERAPSDDVPVTALAFKVVSDPFVGRLLFFRVYSGVVESGAAVLNTTRNQRERWGRIMKMHANSREEVEEVHAGEIAAAIGLKDTFTGDTLCDPAHPVLLESITFPEPVIAVAVEPKTRDDQTKMGVALQKLGEEDPTFRIRFDDETGQTVISGMGELHLEVIVDRMRREYGVEANTGRPQVSYRETIRKTTKAEGRFIRQTGGRGQYGHCVLQVEPLPAGTGFKFEDKTTGGSIPREYISSVRRGVQGALTSGFRAGYPVVDVGVAVIDGSYHDVDSSEMAFETAGSMGMRAALEQANSVILEPVMNLEVVTPEEYYGDVLGDINSRRGMVQGTETRANTQVVSAFIPLGETFGYSTSLRSLSQGRATYSMEFDHYEQVPSKVAEEIAKGAGNRAAS